MSALLYGVFTLLAVLIYAMLRYGDPSARKARPEASPKAPRAGADAMTRNVRPKADQSRYRPF